MTFVIYLMVLLSGLTGLIYQVTWQKYLSVYLGSHALSTSLTLASFFLFLSIGYALVSYWGHRIGRNRILSYGYIEGIIGVYAIFSPQIFDKLYHSWPSYPSDSTMHLLSSLLFAFLLMGLPTLLMGTTIPLLTQGLSHQLRDGHRVHSWVYGVNTLGAFLGSIIGGFYLLEIFGLAQSLNLTGILNCLICLFCLFYCKLTGFQFEGFAPTSMYSQSNKNYGILIVAFLSGFTSFGLESLIIRMANISIGTSNYSYTLIVGAFILAIALGSFFASFADDRRGAYWLVSSQLMLLGATIALYLFIPNWPNWNLSLRFLFNSSILSFYPFLFTIFLVLLLALIVPVALMGMTLPLLFQHLKRDDQYLSQTAGQMYAYNSLGAVLGSITLGYAAFFVLDADQVFKLPFGSLSISSLGEPAFKF